MAKTIEHVHWPDAPDIWMPYAPAIKVKGGTTVYLAGVTAAPVYHHHPHRPQEFDTMPRDMGGQARAALENLKRGLEAVGATFADDRMRLFVWSELPNNLKVANPSMSRQQGRVLAVIDVPKPVKP